MDQPAAVHRLDRAALLRWLHSDAVVAEDGRVWSWHNPAHPGYAYPEAGGLWLALMARETEVDDPLVARVSAWLRRCETEDGIGRDGRRYLFDRAMVLAGQLAWARRHAPKAPGPALASAMQALVDELRARRPVRPSGAATRWSEGFGPHLLKLALPLATWVEARDGERLDHLCWLLDHLGPSAPAGRIASGPRGETTYLHAHCYAAEGLWRLGESPLPPAQRDRARAAAHEAAIWLARVQRSDGGLPPWHDGERGWGPAPADVAAQAVRLWCGLDPRGHARAIDLALGFLARLRGPTGGLRYHEHSNDENTWATLFAVQALDFVRGEARVRALV